MSTRAATILVSLAFVCSGYTQDRCEPWSAWSPDKKLFAAVRAIPEPNLIYRNDLDGFRLIIYDGQGQSPTDIIARHDFQQRTLAHIAWSPDSKFLVFTTDSSGGHSPWHSKAFLYSAPDRSFRFMDESIGSVLNPGEFHFEPPDIAVMGVQDTDAAKRGDTFATRWVEVTLSDKYKEMPRAQ